jgi:hypothetical protein
VQVGSTEFLEAFAMHVSKAASTLASTAEDRLIVKSILDGLLAGQVTKIDFFKVVEDHRFPYGTKRSSPDIAINFINKCIVAGQPDLAAGAVRQVLDMATTSTAETQARAETVLLPLLSHLMAEPQMYAVLPESLIGDLGQAAVKGSLEGIRAQDGFVITRKDLLTLLDVALQSGNSDLIGSL